MLSIVRHFLIPLLSLPFIISSFILSFYSHDLGRLSFSI